MDIEELPFIPTMLIIMIPFITVSVMGMMVSRKLIKHPLLSVSEMRGLSTISSTTGAIFGLLLGLIAVSLWQDFKHLQEKTIEEASHIGFIYKEAERFPTPEGDTLQLLTENYLDAIIQYGWPDMTLGKESAATKKAFHELGMYTMNIKTNDSGEEYVKQDILDRLIKLYRSRRERLHYASTPRIPDKIWIVLLIGVAITISITFLFPIKDIRSKTLLTLSYSGMIGLIIFLMTCLNYPFRGTIRIHPDAYVRVKEGIKILKSEKL